MLFINDYGGAKVGKTAHMTKTSGHKMTLFRCFLKKNRRFCTRYIIFS